MFDKLGKLNLQIDPVLDISHLKRISVGNGSEYAIDGNTLLLLENGKYNKEREDPFKYFRFIALTGVLITLGAAITKVKKIIEYHEYNPVHYTVVFIFLLLTLIPFSFVQKTKPTVLKKSNVKGFKITKKYFVIKVRGWKGFTLIIKHDLKYFTKEGIEELKTYFSQ